MKGYVTPTVIMMLVLSSLTFLPVANAETSAIVVGTSSVAPAMEDYSGTASGVMYIESVDLYFVFWYNGTGVVYSSSPDLTTWADPTYVSSQYKSIYYSTLGHDPTISFAFYNGTAIIYMLGTPDKSGVITWGEAQTVVASGITTSTTPSMIKASDEHIWIGYRLVTTNYPTVVRNDNTVSSGAWATTTGFPVTLNSTNKQVPIMSAGANGKIYCVYNGANGFPLFRIVSPDGSMMAQEDVSPTINCYASSGKAMVVHENISYFIGYHITNNYVWFKERSADGVWDTNITVLANSVGMTAIFPTLTLAPNGDVIAMWMNKTVHTVCLKVLSNGVWGETITLADESSDTFPSYSVPHTQPTTQNDLAILTYLTGTASPYNIKVASYSVFPIPVASIGVSVASGAVPLTVKFTDTSVGATAWAWNFGDGSSSTEQNPTHTYRTVGTYTVTLIATNVYGTDTITRTINATLVNGSSGGDDTNDNHDNGVDTPVNISYLWISIVGLVISCFAIFYPSMPKRIWVIMVGVIIFLIGYFAGW